MNQKYNNNNNNLKPYNSQFKTIPKVNNSFNKIMITNKTKIQICTIV